MMPIRPNLKYILKHSAGLNFQCSIGYASYAPEKSAVVWTIKQFGGGKEYMMRAHFGLPSVKTGKKFMLVVISKLLDDPDKRPPIAVKFEIPYFTTSGIQVIAYLFHDH